MAVIIVCDQLSKFIVLKFVSSLISKNSGVVFGLLPIFGIYLVLIAQAALIVYFIKAKQLTDRIALIGWGLLYGGSISNLIDRVRTGYVVDFVKLPLWPVFNLADLAIVLGVIIVILRLVNLGKWNETR